MANEQKGEVGIEVRGKRYVLKPTFNALCEMDEITGKTFDEIGKRAQRGSLSAIRALVWSYLQDSHADEIRTLKDAGKWIVDAGGVLVVDKALRRITEINTEDAEPSARNPPEGSGTGETSTSKPDAAA